jgi:hypothetical protein
MNEVIFMFRVIDLVIKHNKNLPGKKSIALCIPSSPSKGISRKLEYNSTEHSTSTGLHETLTVFNVVTVEQRLWCS